jgi:hypothetical protein
MEGLRTAIRGATEATLGPPPPRKAPAASVPVDQTFTDFYSAIRPLAEGGAEQFDPVKLADAGTGDNSRTGARLQYSSGRLTCPPKRTGWMEHMHTLLVAGYVAIVAAISLLARWFLGEPE